jgi:hypothetical protein
MNGEAVPLEEQLEGVREIARSTQGATEPMAAFLNAAAEKALMLGEICLQEPGKPPEGKSFDQLKVENENLFRELTPEGYEDSWVDPSYAVEQLGRVPGQAVSSWMMRLLSNAKIAYRGRKDLLSRAIAPLLSMAEATSDGRNDNGETVQGILIDHWRRDLTPETEFMLGSVISPSRTFNTDIAMRANEDPGCLFRYGLGVSEAELKTAEFLSNLPGEDIGAVADTVAKAYVKGFELENKDLSTRKNVSVGIPIGFERLYRVIASKLRDMGMIPFLSSVSPMLPCRQAHYDHKFDAVLHLDEESIEQQKGYITSALDAYADDVDRFSGHLIVTVFGREPFDPIEKKQKVAPDPESAQLYKRFQQVNVEIWNARCPRKETGFSLVSFPGPFIRGDFEEIFRDTMKVNMLDSERYGKIQQAMVDALDRADHVRVRGSGSNQTDLRINMHSIEDPSTQTNFTNELAAQNIPLGEVFTSPLLKGTDGVLHVEETFLNRLRFENLRIEFVDGMIESYSCTNFEDPEESRRYVRDNLLHPHDTLPMGEFAIGSNTEAYAMAKRHGIMDVVPVVILEKMGPHFAIGDTCFVLQEDLPTMNHESGKEVIARFNEKTAKREESMEEAYTFKHIDITVPYHSIASIAAVTPEGDQIEIIRDGRFVLEGTEELNRAIDDVDA